MEPVSQSEKQHVYCRRCGSGHCLRIKRGKMIKTFFGFLPLKRYKCPKCSRKFYSFY